MKNKLFAIAALSLITTSFANFHDRERDRDRDRDRDRAHAHGHEHPLETIGRAIRIGRDLKFGH